MQDEIKAPVTGSETVTETKPTDPADIKREFKKTALKIGIFTLIFFALRYTALFIINAVDDRLYGNMPYEQLYILEFSLSALMIQILPTIIGIFVFGRYGSKEKSIRSMYRVPKNMSRALGNTPTVFGLAQIANLISMILIFLLTGHANIEQKISNASQMQSAGMPGALFMFFLLVVIAPVTEELIFRGFVLDALKPYGQGLAIFFSGILFGIYHANFSQCFYTAAGGIALAYIANATGSIIPTMIIHAIMNSIGGMLNIFINVPSVQEYIFKGNESAIPDADMIWIVLFVMFLIGFFVLAITGFIAAIIKIKNIKRYKVPKVCPEISNPKKVGMLIFNIPMIIAILMIVDTFAGISSGLLK